MIVIIAGSRNFLDYDLLKEYCDRVLEGKEVTQIVSGTARGADTLGERYAEERGIPLKQVPANWDVYGKKAGFMRNEYMAEYGDVLIAFWNRKSRGTYHMINTSKKLGLNVHVRLVEGS